MSVEVLIAARMLTAAVRVLLALARCLEVHRRGTGARRTHGTVLRARWMLQLNHLNDSFRQIGRKRWTVVLVAKGR
uniref:Putative secreted protein n=1 Tax=Anopheles darlingi TaxID=43151 RepID=A0A2M4DEV8_ANODA